jgi:hypothetical protein
MRSELISGGNVKKLTKPVLPDRPSASAPGPQSPAAAQFQGNNTRSDRLVIAQIHNISLRYAFATPDCPNLVQERDPGHVLAPSRDYVEGHCDDHKPGTSQQPFHRLAASAAHTTEHGAS